ncbi:MAG: hypothetical protein K8T90_09800 [Planctomycetes bacterium]|nr:hypothetical protein [Planctomycetota bacterium]
MTRKIIGNLFAESLWARRAAALRHLAGRPAPSPLDPRFMPRDDIVARLAAMATLLRAFADDADILWTPRAVAPERMTDVPGVSRPLLVSGSRPTAGPGDLVWGESSDIAVAVNDRRFAMEVQRTLGCALPGASIAEDMDAAEVAIRVAAEATPAATWIAKAAHSSAARSRVGGRGAQLDDAHRAGVDKLLELHEAVLVEPWLPRAGDFGATALVTESGVEDVDLHDLENTQRGDFRGISFPVSSLRADEAATLHSTVHSVGRALAERGWRGPFGIDAFRWRDASGATRFHPLCEINARLTFGRVARTLAARIATATGLDPAGRWSFRVGDAAELESARSLAHASTGRPLHVRFFELLAPGEPDGVAAWMSAG